MHAPRIPLLTILCVSIMLTGCGGTSAPPSTASNSTSAEQQVTATGGSSQSTATVVDGTGTEPAQSVAIFLDSLRSGDEQAANGVLTERARQELAKTPYEMQPLGTPEGKFEIGRVGYPYEDKSVALVECQWTEPPVPGGEPLTMDIVCEVHQEAPGWRISGLIATIPNSTDTLVLDFEDAASLQATLDSATGQASAPADPSGTNPVPAQTVSGPNSLPSNGQFPALPPAGAAPTGATPNGNVPPSQLPALPDFPG